MKLVGTSLVLFCICAAATAATPPATSRAAAKVWIALVGDSTVQDTSGWGPGFEKSLTGDAGWVNMARGGRSSMSFMREGLWSKTLALKPDYILIQFGHNDQPGKPGRSTDLASEYPKFMNQYVDEARAAGAKPILITSMSRRQWGSDGKIHSTLTPWVDVVKKIAADKNLPLIDLHARTIELYEKLGKERCEREISPRKEDGTVDGTHLNEKGGLMIGAIVAEELSKTVPELAPYIKVPQNADAEKKAEKP